MKPKSSARSASRRKGEITKVEAAHLLACSPGTILNMEKDGRLGPFRRPLGYGRGKPVWISRDQVVAFRDKHELLSV